MDYSRLRFFGHREPETQADRRQTRGHRGYRHGSVHFPFPQICVGRPDPDLPPSLLVGQHGQRPRRGDSDRCSSTGCTETHKRRDRVPTPRQGRQRRGRGDEVRVQFRKTARDPQPLRPADRRSKVHRIIRLGTTASTHRAARQERSTAEPPALFAQALRDVVQVRQRRRPDAYCRGRNSPSRAESVHPGKHGRSPKRRRSEHPSHRGRHRPARGRGTRGRSVRVIKVRRPVRWFEIAHVVIIPVSILVVLIPHVMLDLVRRGDRPRSVPPDSDESTRGGERRVPERGEDPVEPDIEGRVGSRKVASTGRDRLVPCIAGRAQVWCPRRTQIRRHVQRL